MSLPPAKASFQHNRTINYRRDAEDNNKLNDTPGNKIDTTTDPSRLQGADSGIIAVPIPVTKAKDPDLEPVRSATETVGRNLKRGAIVVLESSVYHGDPKILYGPFSGASGLVWSIDFKIGYLPERSNPSEEDHRMEQRNRKFKH
ncbi:MAG: hypothetical protein QMD46_13295 [Methanomicrobiales archaeon]|nr:hypothetical protein [Methanomicrobiales archaeon]MDI6877549.1 hypothetical protein [Methanomicrobiales archaeon]